MPASGYEARTNSGDTPPKKDTGGGRDDIQERSLLRIGVIGCGHWGPNHIRVFSELDRSIVTACAEPNPERLTQVRRRFPNIQGFTDFSDLISDGNIDAVVVATPTSTHAAIVRDALLGGKHVLVEKPLCTSSAEAHELGLLAENEGRVLMAGHVFLFNEGIIRLRQAIAGGEVGQVHYLDAVRTNLGPVRGDVNALVDLGTHDISIFNYLLNDTPVAISAAGRRISQDLHEDVCFATLRYSKGTLAHLHVSWLNPRKVRTLTVVGDKAMAHWDDIDPCDVLRLYDKGLEEPPYYDTFGEFKCLLRSGDVRIPHTGRTEPLVRQGQAFLDWVLDGISSHSGVPEALMVVQTLEAAAWSLKNDGRFCPIPAPMMLPAAQAERETLDASTFVRTSYPDYVHTS